jgi:hypothetical protein
MESKVILTPKKIAYIAYALKEVGDRDSKQNTGDSNLNQVISEDMEVLSNTGGFRVIFDANIEPTVTKKEVVQPEVKKPVPGPLDPITLEDEDAE